ncbi:hypothetical protein HTZ84_20950 [Haloterrigena sp. SYSU A558-1]|uniref:Uncharacterized protein n=1 Tax=Haloterrigena gelatinilytica TaxID=2741724 RepID=A0ABX2LK02_9EURY|nr:hypothetical protein [Haloterrigena gelatinilytica]NUC74733.1 hypothetical protein [Haloterrigena gelatinilytica]
MSDDEQGTEVSGVVTEFHPSQNDNKPHGVYVDGDRYTTFEDEDVAEIEEGTGVRFRYEQNDEHRNIVPGSVDIVATDADPNVYGSTDQKVMESTRDRSIRCNVALKEARELCQPLITEDMSEPRFHEVVELIGGTAEQFAEKLHELNQQTPQGEQ